MEDMTADLCSRCSSIPWDRLEQEHWGPLWMDEKPTLGDLQTSSCRVCRLIISTILTGAEQHVPLESRVKIFWDSKIPNGDDCLGSILLSTEPEGSVAELILTTDESIEEDMTASYKVASKRADFAKIDRWLEACKSSHESCKYEIAVQLSNLRVIDCIKKVVVDAPKDCSFVALSYVWGRLPADNHVLGSPIAFPPTIEDAVECTQKLGYRYLWVDRYCINQEDSRNKGEQISQMDRIYATAKVTIVAAAGADPSYGLVGISRDCNWPLSDREPLGSSRFLHPVPKAAEDYIAQSTWFSRAWTLQEGYLSKRILCFTEREAVFVCKSYSSTAEFTPRTYGSISKYQRSFTKNATRIALSSQIKSLSDASSIMATYSRRVLGYDSDTLSAITGILNVLRRRDPPIYHIWGVPFTITRGPDAAHNTDCTVSVSLNWTHFESSRRLLELPSWSTLGWRGRADHEFREPEITPHFMIKYWSGDRYQDLGNSTCNLDYTYCSDATHRSQYLEITTDFVQVELQRQCLGDAISYFLRPTFIRRKEVEKVEEDRPSQGLEGPLFRVFLSDEPSFDDTLPVLCATMTLLDIVSDSWSSFQDKDPLFLFFQKKAKSYERVGACKAYLYSIDSEGKKSSIADDLCEFIPSGEEGAWDQVAERRTFLLG